MASTASLEKELKELKAENKRLQKLVDDKRKSTQLSGGRTAGATRGGRGGSGTGGGASSSRGGASTQGGNKVTWLNIVENHCWAYNNSTCSEANCPKKHVCSMKVGRDTPCNQAHPKKEHK